MESPKRQKMNDEDPKFLVRDIDFLPNEILMNIFSYLNIKELYKCAHVNKKFRQISHDKSFWKSVNLYKQRVSSQFIAQILRLGTEYLNLQEVTILDDTYALWGDRVYDPDGESRPSHYASMPRKNNLKYLNMAFSSVEDTFLVKLLRTSVCLKKISLREVNQKDIEFRHIPDQDRFLVTARRSRYIDCLLPNAKMLTSLDLSINTRSVHDLYPVDSASMEEILLNCVELKEANFEGQITDVRFFANNLTPKIEKLNISHNYDFVYEHVLQLVKRCNNITELDLDRCDLDIARVEEDNDPKENQHCLIAISKNLSQSLVKLQLGTTSTIYHEFLESLPKLRYLWKAPWTHSDQYGDSTEIMKEYKHIYFNEGTAKIAHCANEYFEPEKGLWEVKCPAVDLFKTQ